jgi:prepilin-type N-terminal cleavage/methylation domain-containing protein
MTPAAVNSSFPNRRGFSLVETIVAMTIFAIVMAALGGLAVKIAAQGRSGVNSAAKSAAFVEKMNSLATVSYELLPGRSGCTHVATPPFPRTECITVVNQSANVRRVRIVITPDGGTMRPDTVLFDKTARATANPFNTP